MIKEIDISTLDDIINTDRCAFLCGNGFSINFDDDFMLIYERLFSAHKEVIHNSKYNLKAETFFKKKFRDNYKSVLDFLRPADQKTINTIFEDGILFADSIMQNQKLIDQLEENKFITGLVFGVSELNLVNSIAAVGSEKGFKYVSIEYWTILIYFYYAILKLDECEYALPDDNLFITLLHKGDKVKGEFSQDTGNAYSLYQYVISNGFNTYYRMLFCTAILNNGKAIYLEKLKNISKIDLVKLCAFLDYFQVIFTLNYDLILENIQNKKVYHLHGNYVPDQQEYVYGQSLGLNYENNYFSFSDILIGDYFINKTAMNIINGLAKNNPHNKPTLKTSTIIENQISKEKCDTIVIFGMSIDNDQHIIRNIIVALEKLKEGNTKIIYCNFADWEKGVFSRTYNDCITFSEELSNFARSITLLSVRSQEIVKKYFLR